MNNSADIEIVENRFSELKRNYVKTQKHEEYVSFLDDTGMQTERMDRYH